MIYAVLLLLPVALQAAVDDQGAGAFNLTPNGVKTTDPRRYLSACRENARRGANCNSYSCYTRYSLYTTFLAESFDRQINVAQEPRR